MEINEKMLINMDWSSDLKLACYELQQIRPLQDAEIIRETAQIMEDVLRTVDGVQAYPFTNFSTFLRKNSKPKATQAERAETKDQLALMKKQKMEEA